MDLPISQLPMVIEMGRSSGFWPVGALRPHRNHGIEVCRIRAGRFQWSCAGRTWNLGPGDGYVTLPWQLHGGQDDLGHRGAVDHVVIGLDRCTQAGAWRFGTWCTLDRPARALVEHTLLGLSSPMLSQARPLGPIFDRFWDEVGQRRPGWAGQVRAILGELLLTSARHASSAPANDEDQQVGAALEMVAERLDESWRLATIAGLADLGRTRFSERCVALTGLSPRRWLLNTRLDRARTALRHGQLSVTKIALDHGFATSQHFASAFRRAYGLGPLAWRQSKGGETGAKRPKR